MDIEGDHNEAVFAKLPGIHLSQMDMRTLSQTESQ